MVNNSKRINEISIETKQKNCDDQTIFFFYKDNKSKQEISTKNYTRHTFTS